MTTFADLGVRQALIDVLQARGISEPFPIQTQTLPDTLADDVLAWQDRQRQDARLFRFRWSASWPACGGCRCGRRDLFAPTRELASQITATLEPLAAANGLRVTTIFGGVPQGKAGVGAEVGHRHRRRACPGRLEDLIKQKLIHLDAIEITVIDEADHMADLGFLPGVTRILAATPSTGQRLLFSATMDNDVDKLVNRFMTDPVMHSVDSANSPVSQMTHHVFHVPDAQAKKDVVHRLASGTGGESCSCGPSITPANSPSSSPNPVFRRWICTAIFRSPHATETSLPSAMAMHVCWWRPISPHAACTSTASNWWCTSTRPRSTRRICTGPAGPRAPQCGRCCDGRIADAAQDTAVLMRRAGIRVTPQEVTVDSAAVHAVAGEAAPYQAPAPKVAAPQRPSRPRSGPSSRGRARRPNCSARPAAS